MLAAIARINEAVEMGRPVGTFTALGHEDAHITNLDEMCQDKYQKCLLKAKVTKQKVVH